MVWIRAQLRCWTQYMPFLIFCTSVILGPRRAIHLLRYSTACTSRWISDVDCSTFGSKQYVYPILVECSCCQVIQNTLRSPAWRLSSSAITQATATPPQKQFMQLIFTFIRAAWHGLSQCLLTHKYPGLYCNVTKIPSATIFGRFRRIFLWLKVSLYSSSIKVLQT